MRPLPRRNRVAGSGIVALAWIMITAESQQPLVAPVTQGGWSEAMPGNSALLVPTKKLAPVNGVGRQPGFPVRPTAVAPLPHASVFRLAAETTETSKLPSLLTPSSL